MKQEMHVLGIDIAKRMFHAVGMDNRGNVVYRKRLSRHDLIPFIAKPPSVLIGLEACGGAHYWARRFCAYGHEVKLMAPQFVKPLSLSRLHHWLPRMQAHPEVVQGTTEFHYQSADAFIP